jgi:hypothetical protein
MRNHTEKTKSEGFSVRNSSAKGENENSTHCVLNLEKTWFGRFSTQRVLNFSPRLKMPRKTKELEFGTHCVPNLEKTFPIKIYPDKCISILDQAELELEAEIEQGMRELEGLLK